MEVDGDGKRVSLVGGTIIYGVRSLRDEQEARVT